MSTSPSIPPSHRSEHASWNGSRGSRGCSARGSPYPRLQRKFVLTCPSGKNSCSQPKQTLSGASAGRSFEENAAGGDGGGLFSINSTLAVARSRFSHNSSGFRGGAAEVFNTYETTAHRARISTSVFEDNT